MFKTLSKTSQTHMLIDCDTDLILEVLKQARDVNMLGDYENYLFTSLDSHTLDYIEFQPVMTNITFLRLVSPSSPEMQEAMKDWNNRDCRHVTPDNMRVSFIHRALVIIGTSPITTRCIFWLQVAPALMYDAVCMFAISLNRADAAQPIETESLNCTQPEAWSQGEHVNTYMKMVSSFNYLVSSCLFYNAIHALACLYYNSIHQ
ncbi:hypothetical protein PR048_033024 [Dryococelus australis]|uniref:Receptor ligand binding region domain-containing protein n=1 Tax=Dryococelus australis TaxID=614101 RepID=A0ABQ9G3W5_9NEOP|nr:hypothetical protein PR048_033024 [Dryococelus australis]